MGVPSESTRTESPCMSCSPEMRILLLLGLSLLNLSAASKPVGTPSIIRIYPIGGQSGTTVPAEILGQHLANATSVEFDCKDLAWIRTTGASAGKVTGLVSISPEAALGPHMLRVVTKDGYSTSAMFNVGLFPSVAESEPNDAGAGAADREIAGRHSRPPGWVRRYRLLRCARACWGTMGIRPAFDRTRLRGRVSYVPDRRLGHACRV